MIIRFEARNGYRLYGQKGYWCFSQNRKHTCQLNINIKKQSSRFSIKYSPDLLISHIPYLPRVMCKVWSPKFWMLTLSVISPNFLMPSCLAHISLIYGLSRHSMKETCLLATQPVRVMTWLVKLSIKVTFLVCKLN